MQVTQIIHEGGLKATSMAQSRQIVETHRLRPVLVTRREAAPSETLDTLLSTSGTPLGVRAAVVEPPTHDAALLFKGFALEYDLNAAIYHCENLARTYASIVAVHQR